MRVSFIDRINAVDRKQWNAVAGTDYPFTRYEFLHALEASATVTRDTGWQPQHLVVYADSDSNENIIAVMPLYLKYHSYGEYVFDWSWADAYQRHGVSYYPKLLSAIPFTPASGPRLAISKNANRQAVTRYVLDALIARATDQDLSSIHILFPSPGDCQQFRQQAMAQRSGVQFHWYNQGYSDFNDFLATFNSRKRKNIKRERRRIKQQKLQLKVFSGSAISPDLWQHFYSFYQFTYAKRSGHGGYLNQQFFERVANTMAEQLLLVLAYDGAEPVAGALYFHDSTTLYGRYWGCSREYDFLHFETCYYQGIEYCIANKLQRFDPGTQGEHKIQRGFIPVETCSIHWIAHPEFKSAIADFLQQDNQATRQYIRQARAFLPYKNRDDA